ncbi:hypothetical protein MKQ70_29060 [Chitinophaga sedimenti]|uniref:hypothetical protein n=1 Tax=Chitinophaga sedimenti TaxID=2033606 RepID=UPI0020045722|nr:hypothetical protein [Chitinophaga sedimenti]MCK7558815.1 hypothetical protein [Chitinophaga sedimenti]
MKTLQQCAAERILIIDGAMGTMIQRYKLEEADYRGERFKDYHTDVKETMTCSASRSRKSLKLFTANTGSRCRYH